LHQEQNTIRNRILFFFIFLFIIFILLSLRLVWIQVINSAEYQHKALNQRVKELIVSAKRGIIYDKSGRKLAVTLPGKTVVALPDNIINPKKTAEKLSKMLNVEYKTVYRRITGDASAVFLKRKIDKNLHEKLLEEDIKGITFTEESRRYYPESEFASHIVGFAGIDNNGLNGIELSYDKYLNGNPGKILIEKDATGKTIPDGIIETVPSRNGSSIVLTLDHVIQYIAERELKDAEKQFDFSGGSIIVMNPNSGDILAMANTPNFDPNNFSDYPQKNWRNRAITDVFEPGSTFKIITTASALEEGVISENDNLTCPGFVYVGGEKISCWKTYGHREETFAEVVKNSCNPGFVDLGLKLGKEDFYSYIRAFGFGSQTGIKLPGEAFGIIPNYSRINSVELATFSFGHGLSVTPIQLISAVSAVANGGKLMQPRLVKEILDEDGNIILENESAAVRRVISEETSKKTRDLLTQVVEQGTGTQAAIEGYKIAGKTGTAKHYNKDIYDSSFIGMLPADKPQLVILVVLYDVDGETYYGSQTAAPVFRNLTEDIIRYLDLKPDEDKNIKEINKNIERVTLPDVRGMNYNSAEEMLRNRGFNVKLIGENDIVKDQLPEAGSNVNFASTVWLFDGGVPGKYSHPITVPDFRGLNASEAVRQAEELGINVVLSGSGEVIGQSVYPGIRVEPDRNIELKLR